MRRILVVEDDEHVGSMIEEILAGTYEVHRAYSGTEALLAAKECRPDLVLLDLMLPGMAGEEVLEHLLPLPVLIVSAKPDPERKADLLFRGAADYITKPFYPKELLARISAQFRKAEAPDAHAVSQGDITLRADEQLLEGPQADVHLTKTECAILRLLMSSPKKVFAKSVILDRIADDTLDGTESSLRMHISNLRRKLRSAGAGDCIESVWGIGFKMRGPD